MRVYPSPYAVKVIKRKGMYANVMIPCIVLWTMLTVCAGQYAEYARRKEMERRRGGEHHPWNDVCLDVYPTNKCRKLRDYYQFCEEYYMDVLCKKTCGYCRMHSQVDCNESAFGCCFDKVTPKKDLHGSNCPPCKDKHEDLCEKYKSDCNSTGFVGSWMQLNCKRKCKICQDQPLMACKDSDVQKSFCPLWKRAGLCKKASVLMQKQCRKTCGFCTNYNTQKVSKL